MTEPIDLEQILDGAAYALRIRLERMIEAVEARLDGRRRPHPHQPAPLGWSLPDSDDTSTASPS